MDDSAELNDLLLEAAGRTNKRGRNNPSPPASRRRHGGSYSDDDGSDSKDDDSDDGRGYGNMKPTGSQAPLKKRLKATERDDDRSSQDDDRDDDDDSDDDSFGSDLYKDEADREKLAQMSELDRELLLAERADKKDTKAMLMRSKRNDKVSQPSKERESPRRTSLRGVRSSARSADRAAAKDDALNELRAKRMKHQDPEAHRKLRDTSRAGSTRRGSSPVKKKPVAARSSSSESESGSHSDEESTGDGGLPYSDEEKPDSNVVTFEDIKEITIKRSQLAKWLMEPFFDELIVGCFVRVGIGKTKSGMAMYRLCVVRNVDASDTHRQYKLENKMTCKFLNCVWGNESSAARWQMAMVSDHSPDVKEYEQWSTEVERSGGRMPTKQDILDKKEAIERSRGYTYDADTVKRMLQEKKSATWKPLNVAAEKDRLRREMEVARGRNDDSEVERIKARLEELEASRQIQEKNSKAVKLAEMNRKNRVENFKNASDVKPVAAGLKEGDAGYDPFSRRWTRSINYYVSKKQEGDDEAAAEGGGDTGDVAAAAAGGGSKAGGDGGLTTTVAALDAAANAGKLVDTNAPVDQGTEANKLHNFELKISLAELERFGGPHGAQAGFMARKQRIESMIGYRVPDNDGRRHTLTLTVSDYIRRRGLL